MVRFCPCPDTNPVPSVASPVKRKPGHQLGVDARPRDEKGWIIPAEGTKSRECYDLMKLGKNLRHIAQLIGMTMNQIHQMSYRIKRPEVAKARIREHRKGPANVPT